MCCFRIVPLRGEKTFKPHKTRSWYLLGVLFKIFDEHPHPLYMGDPHPPPGILPPILFARSNLQKVNVIRTEVREGLQYFLYETYTNIPLEA